MSTEIIFFQFEFIFFLNYIYRYSALNNKSKLWFYWGLIFDHSIENLSKRLDKHDDKFDVFL